ncbi:MAG: secretin N-terminal domain-containing protein [bacterium]|nr:secretin N-terminal domain-containing protein [bacterium]
MRLLKNISIIISTITIMTTLFLVIPLSAADPNFDPGKLTVPPIIEKPAEATDLAQPEPIKSQPPFIPITPLVPEAAPTAPITPAPPIAAPALAKPEKEQQLIALNFQNTDISLVLKFFSDVTGLTFILGDNVRGNVTVISNKRIPVDEAMDMLQSILEIKGLTMVRYENMVKVVTQTEAAQKSIEIRTNQSVQVGDDRVVTQIIPLKYIVANEVKNDLQPLISRNGNVVVDERTNSLILTDVGSNIKKILKVLENIDVAIYGDRIKIDIISLQNSEENALAAKIKAILLTSKPRIVNYLEIIPDNRLHALIVITTQNNLAVVKDLALKLDRETATANDNTKVFSLQNSKAADIAKILNEMLKPGTNSVIDGGFNVVIDDRTNSLIITTANQNYPRIQRILEKLDVRTAQVLIKALMVEVSLTKENKLGVEWSYTQGWGENNPKMSGTLQQNFGVGNFIGDGLKYSVLKSDNSVSALLQALATDQKVNILSTPHVLASNNQEAIIKVGEEVPILKEVHFVTDEAGKLQTVKTYDYKNISIELKVTPLINTAKDVALDVSLSIKKILGTNAELNAPILADREAKTKVVVQDGQTVVIGGLIKDDDSYSDSKIPLLGDIPILGWLFKKQGLTKEKTELMVFITPYVVTSSIEAEKMTREQESKISIKTTPNRLTAKEYFEEGQIAYKKGDYQGAIDKWKKVIEINPKDKIALKAEKYIKKAEERMSPK